MVVLALPVGYLISYMSRDELVVGRKWFVLLLGVFAVLGVGSYVLGEHLLVWTSVFIFLTGGVSLWKSYDLVWTKKEL